MKTVNGPSIPPLHLLNITKLGMLSAQESRLLTLPLMRMRITGMRMTRRRRTPRTMMRVRVTRVIMIRMVRMRTVVVMIVMGEVAVTGVVVVLEVVVLAVVARMGVKGAVEVLVTVAVEMEVVVRVAEEGEVLSISIPPLLQVVVKIKQVETAHLAHCTPLRRVGFYLVSWRPPLTRLSRFYGTSMMAVIKWHSVPSPPSPPPEEEKEKRELTKAIPSSGLSSKNAARPKEAEEEEWLKQLSHRKLSKPSSGDVRAPLKSVMLPPPSIHVVLTPGMGHGGRGGMLTVTVIWQ